MKKFLYLICLAGIVFSGWFCSNLAVAGGSSSTDNGKIAGTIRTPGGAAAPRTQVLLYPADYDPVKDGAAVRADTTDNIGGYSFIHVDSGSYNVASVHLDDRTRSLAEDIVVAGDTVIVPADTLHTAGEIKVTIPSGFDANYGYVYIPGTSIFSLLSENTGFVILDSVPANVNLSVYYSVRGKPAQRQLVRDSVVVAPGGIATIAYVGWSYSQKLVLNTTASGAGVAGMVTGFPALVRLTGANFSFAEANAGGADVRFTKSNGTPLPYEIERWDSAGGLAEIWVNVDTVFGNDDSHFMTMYWGNPAATGASNGAKVFDTADGFQGVWHLNDPVSGPVKDATINGYNGIAVNAGAQTSITAMIGAGREFSALDSGYITISNTANSKLSFPENGTYAVSAWVYMDTLDGKGHAIATKGNQQYNLEMFRDKWEFAEFKTSHTWEMSSAPATSKKWTFLTGVRSQAKQYLFVDGACVDTLSEIETNNNANRNTGFNVMFGRTDGVFEPDFPYYFHGALDEIRVLNVAPSADWVKLCYMNQKSQDALVEFK
jgi:Concanavalin A-like lectin/glucanases superfamily/Domain of unknown function (DUF2341)